MARATKVIWTPQPGPQAALLACPVPEIFFGGARGGGKTDALLGSWVAHASRYGRHAKGILFRRTWPELEQILSRSTELFTPLGARWIASRKTWIMPNGATLKLRYMKRDADASNYQGHAYTWMGFDELPNWSRPEPVDEVRATLRSPEGIPVEFRASGNPGGVGHKWVKERFILPAPPMTPHPDPQTGTLRVFIPSRLSDNPAMMKNDPGYANRLKGVGPPWLVRAWLEGDWDASPEGGFVKAHWFRAFQPASRADYRWIVQSWDTAYKAKEANDPSCCTTWAITLSDAGVCYDLLDVYVERLIYPELKKALVQQAELWRPTTVLIEDKGSGTSLIQEARAETNLPVVPIEPEGDKITRLLVVSGIIEAGLVRLPRSAPWRGDYVDELTLFPLAANDDRVDSTSQFLRWASGRVFALDMMGASAGRRQSAEADGALVRGDTDDAGFGRIKTSNDMRGF